MYKFTWTVAHIFPPSYSWGCIASGNLLIAIILVNIVMISDTIWSVPFILLFTLSHLCILQILTFSILGNLICLQGEHRLPWDSNWLSITLACTIYVHKTWKVLGNSVLQYECFAYSCCQCICNILGSLTYSDCMRAVGDVLNVSKIYATVCKDP